MPTKLYVVGNKVNIPDVSLIAKHETNDRIIFIGKMNYEPNVVAVIYFAECIFPNIQKYHPHSQFIIVGAHPDERVKKLAERKDITVTGYVDSIELYLQTASIVVAPMLTGSGIQNKIIQAMAYGCCVVTTSIGAEGLTIYNNEIAIADEDREMIQIILLLLENPEKRREMGRLARAYVIENLSEEVISKQFWNFIDNK